MNFCIVTFQRAYNFGAILQAYALQTFISNGYGPTKILDYHSDAIDSTYKMPAIKKFVDNPKSAVNRTLQFFLYAKKREKIDAFRSQLNLTKDYCRDDISKAVDEADVFITGSDQVWNYQIIEKDKTYFLDFAKGKIRASYAASFGVGSVPDDFRDFYTEQLKNIDYLSCRELQGCNLIKELTGRESSVMNDPTMLIDHTDWAALSVKPRQDKYILVYKITKADKLISFAKTLSKKTGLPIVYIPNDLKNGFVGKTLLNVGPEEWLGYIKNASYVVTNSFHGAVFSIIFGIKFFVEFSDKTNATTSRLYSLLSKFEMEDRSLAQYNDSMLDVELDRNKIEKVISDNKKEAEEYFDRIVRKSGE